MNKTIALPLYSLLIALILNFAGPIGAAHAQSPTPETPTLANIEDTPENRVSFDEIGAGGDILLLGPYDSRTMTFSLPPEWQPTPGKTALLLDLTWTVSSLVPAQGESRVEGLIAGAVEVTLNDEQMQTTVLSGSGSDNLVIPFQDNTLIAGTNRLKIDWSASTSCDFNLSSSLNISPTSRLIIPHSEVPLSPKLASFPAPFYQPGAIRPIAVTIVVADSASQTELQAALTAAAGLGRQSAGGISLDLTAEGSLTEAARNENHLILVGSWDSLVMIDALTLEASKNQVGDQGIVEISASPWNPARVVLLISGMDEKTTGNAALAVSRGVLLTGSATGSLALVSDAVAGDFSESYSDKRTLADLGQENMVFDTPGSSVKSLFFAIPPEAAAGAQSFLELRFSHSQLLDYLRSSIIVRLNGAPIGSLRMSDTTAAFSSAQIVIPPTALQPGDNHIEIQADLTPRSICSDPRRSNSWVTIYPDSSLYLPLSSGAISREALTSIWNYPYPFTYSSTLDKTLFLLRTADYDGWSAAARLAFDLGTHTPVGQISTPVVALDTVDAAQLSKYDLLLVGQPDLLEMHPALVENLPVVFGSDNQPLETAPVGVQFDTSGGAATGYLLSGKTPGGRMVLAVLGNDQSGLSGAVDALIGGDSDYQSANFAVIQNSAVLTEKINLGDTATSEEVAELASTGDADETSGGEQVAAETGSRAENLPSTSQRHAWIIPSLSAAAALFILILSWRFYLALRSRRK
jgi:cellulose synthase operon protein B